MKKTGTEQFIPKIKSGFIKTMYEKYSVNKEESEIIVENFLRIIEDASSYLFSYNHSLPYTYIGYICAYLKYYYPLEFFTVGLNISKGNDEKTGKIVKCLKQRNIKIKNPEFGYSKGEYFCDKKTNTIFKGIGSIKGLGMKDGEQLYELAQNKKYNNFLELYSDIKNKTEVNDGKIKSLIKLNFFKDFGNINYLLDILEIYNNFNNIKTLKKDNLNSLNLTEDVIRNFSEKETAKQFSQLNNKAIMNYLISKIENKNTSLKELITYEVDLLGYPDTKIETLKEPLFYVLELKEFKNKKSSTYYPTLYNIKTGEEIKYKVGSYQTYLEIPFKEKDIIKIDQESKKQKRRLNKNTGKWEILKDEFNNILDWWTIY